MKKKQNTPQKSSLRSLAKETFSDRETIKIWLEAENIQPSDHDAALAVIAERQKRQSPGVAVDKASGLSWFQAGLKESALRQRRENLRAEQIERRELFPTEVFYAVLRLVSTQIELVPSKAKAEFGLTDQQEARLQALYDAARNDGARLIETELDRQLNAFWSKQK